MAKQKKRADGRLCKTFTFERKKYFVYGRTKEELENKVIEKKLSLKKQQTYHDNPTLDQFHELWADNRKGIIKPATMIDQNFMYNSCANIKINGKRFGDYKLSKIKAEDIRVIQKALIEINSTSTVNKKIFALSHIFRDAVNERYIEYNPCVVVKPLKRTEKKTRDTIHRALTAEETKLFIEYAKNSYYLNVFKLALLTGMRIGEIGALCYSDIYDNMIHITKTLTKNEVNSFCIGEETKTRQGNRTIPINKDIKKVIEEQKELNKILNRDKITSIQNPLFKSPEGKILRSSCVNNAIKNICKKAGIEPVSAHSFRATFATRCIEQGVQPRTLQELLGHADFGMTMNLYGHVLDDTKEKAMNSLNIAL
jgi:integrase